MKTEKNYILFILVYILFIISCKNTGQEAADSAEYEISKEFTSGPATLYIRINKKEVTIAESINMIIDVKVEKEYHIELPEFGENLQQFKIVDFYDPGQKLIDDTHIGAIQEYTLEPYLSGEYIIPVIRVKFWTEAEGPEDPHILESEEISITVTSILDDDMKELVIKDITGPVLPPPPDLTWVIFLVTGILLAGGGITVLILWLKKKKEGGRPVITIPAHEYAYKQLEMLINRDYIEKGEYKLFYFGVSMILRHYIENRFHLHAPEQTTEEFLYDLKDSKLLTGELKSILKEFLWNCDMVKFAKHIPSSEEIQKTFDTCKNFIMTTEDINARIEEPVATSAIKEDQIIKEVS